MTTPILFHEISPELSVADALRSFQNERLLTLFDSAADVRERDARYSILTADPVKTVRLESVHFGEQPFETIRTWQNRLAEVAHGVSANPPFCGGIAGMMSYELGHAFERLPKTSTDHFDTPDLIAGLFDWSIVWDHVSESVTLFVINLNGMDTAERRRDWVLERLHAEASTERSVEKQKAPRSGYELPHHAGVVSNFDENRYVAAVEQVIDYIRAGDIFQANLSQQLTAPWDGSAIELYQRVRQQNPAPFCGLLQADDFGSTVRTWRCDLGQKQQVSHFNQHSPESTHALAKSSLLGCSGTDATTV